jgi:exonuclease III
MHVIKIATLNFNGITAPTRVGMSSDFITRHELDKLFVQEVTNPDTQNIRGYNIRTSMRGTAILVRNAMSITTVHKLPSGRAMSAEYRGIRLINVYAPSGSARRTEIEDFLSRIACFLLYRLPHTILGDFNCVLNPADNIGSFLPSRALSEIVRRLVLVDTWKQDPLRPTFTHRSYTTRPPFRTFRLRTEKIRRNHTSGVY